MLQTTSQPVKEYKFGGGRNCDRNIIISVCNLARIKNTNNVIRRSSTSNSNVFQLNHEFRYVVVCSLLIEMQWCSALILFMSSSRPACILTEWDERFSQQCSPWDWGQIVLYTESQHIFSWKRISFLTAFYVSFYICTGPQK